MKTIPLILLLFSVNVLFAQLDINKKIDSLYLELDAAKDNNTYSSILYDLGETYLSINLDSTVSIFNRVKNESVKINDKKLEIKAIIGLGKAYTDQTNFDSAKMNFDLAEKLIKDQNLEVLKQSLYMNQGILLFHQANYDDAKNKFKEVLDLALEENDPDEISRGYNNLALCLSYSGNYEEALKMHIESAKIAEGLNDPLSLAKSYNNIGLLYYDLNEHEKSEEYLLKSLKIKKEEGDKIGVIGSFLNLGNAQRKLGVKLNDSSKLYKSKNYFEEALKLSEETNYIRGLNNAYVNLALVETTLGNYINGVEFGKRAVKACMEGGDFQKEMVARVNLGDAYRYNKQYVLAEQELLKGLQMADEKNNLFIKKETLLILSLLKSEQRKFEKALDYHKEYIKISDSISSGDVKNKVHELETKYQTEKKEKEILSQRADLAEKELNLNKKNVQLIGLSILIIILGLSGYMIYNQQKLKNRQLQKENELKDALLKIETQNRLQEQRLRISRDLHDNIGAQLTFIISSIDNLKYGFKLPEKLKNKLESINTFTTATIYELRDTIWAMNKSEIRFDDLQVRISNFIEKANLSSEHTKFSFNLNDAIVNDIKFSSAEGMNIYRITQEAINNALKYGKASEICVDLLRDTKGLEIIIKDNGNGFDLQSTELGNGINNMKKRALEINADLHIESMLGQGTTIRLFKFFYT